MSTKIIKAGFLVSIAGIKTPDNFASLLAMPRIKRLAASIKAVSQIAPVVLQKVGEGYKLWAGHDRLAAATLAGHARIRADIREGSDADFLLLQMAENDERRPIGELIDEYRETDKPPLTSDVKPRKSTTYKKSATARQDEEIADARGVSADAERKRRERSAKKREREEETAEPEAPAAAPPEPDPLPEGFNAFGLEVTAEHRERVWQLAIPLNNWERITTNILTELARLEKASNPPVISHQAAEAIRDKARALGHVVREAIPTSLCFYCKNDDRSVVDCPACGATGLAGRHAGDNVPPELKTIGAAARIAVDGRFILASEASAPPAKVSPAKKRGGVRLVTVDDRGNETDVPLPSGDDEELAF